MLIAVAGDGFWDKVYEMGHLHSLNIFWDPIYLTTDANVIKVWRSLVHGAHNLSVVVYSKTILATDFQTFEKGVANSPFSVPPHF